MLPINSMQIIHDILRTSTSIAVVGFSPKESRPSHIVGKYLIEAGFRVYPVNPGMNEILGHVCYPDLFSIPDPIDVVDIFRRSEEVTPLVEAAIRIGAKVIWMQQGISNQEAADLAEKSGLQVVMDRCIKIDHMQMV